MKTVDLNVATIPEVTIIPNTIIDNYLLEANGLQVKVYLYILRQTAAGNCVHISDIADYFNETEKEVSRAIAFWEARSVFSCCKSKQVPLPAPKTSLTAASARAEALKTTPRVPVKQPIPDTDVNSMDADQLAQLQDSQDFKELLFVAETYMGKPLRRNDCNILLFIKYTLNFSNQLIEYLLEYCAELNKKSFHYVQTVACSWAEQGITTPEEAKFSGMMYNKRIYTVMNALGKKGDPSATELEHIKRWHDEYGFETDVISHQGDFFIHYQGSVYAPRTGWSPLPQADLQQKTFRRWKDSELISLLSYSLFTDAVATDSFRYIHTLGSCIGQRENPDFLPYPYGNDTLDQSSPGEE